MTNIPLGSSVRIKRTDRNPHRTGGTLIAVIGDNATVRPVGHPGTVTVPLKSIVIWKSKNEARRWIREKGESRSGQR